MKKVFTLVIVMLVALTTSKVFAQSGDYKKFSLGIGIEGALPVSGFSSVYSIAFISAWALAMKTQIILLLCVISTLLEMIITGLSSRRWTC